MTNINVALQKLVLSTKCFCLVLLYIERYFESFALLPLTADIDPLCSGRILLLSVFEYILQYDFLKRNLIEIGPQFCRQLSTTTLFRYSRMFVS